jgi:pyridoxal phosphate enzyme (YggS family)
MDKAENFQHLCSRIAAAGLRAGHPASLLAVSKMQSAEAIREVAGFGQMAFGENYVQEALRKQAQLKDLPLEWHAIGPLQSNKARDVAENFHWLQTLDRVKLVESLNRFRPPAMPPLDVLIQVNIDDEASKSGCNPQKIAELAAAVSAAPRLRLRGLMAIPAPHGDPSCRQLAFLRMRELFDRLAAAFPGIDTLSMGMSEDFELAIESGATLVRIGSSLFGERRHNTL